MQKPLLCLPHSDDFQHSLARASFWQVEKSSPSANNFFRGIPFSHEDKIHEHIQESLLVGRRAKGNFAQCFCRFSKEAFCRKSPISTGRNDRLKPGKLLKLI